MTVGDIHTAVCVAVSSIAVWLLFAALAAFAVDAVIQAMRRWRKRTGP